MTTLRTDREKILFVFRQTPYGNTLAREGLDTALAMAAFDQQISILFTGDGLWQLCGNQQVPSTQKNHLKMLSACPVYEIDKFYVYHENRVLIERILQGSPLNCEVLDLIATESLLSQHQHVLIY